MTQFTITVTLDVEDPFQFHDERTAIITIPPDYDIEDRRRFYAVRLESLVDDMFEERGWFTPLRHALLANDARARRIEELARETSALDSDVIIAILETPSQQAIDLWGEGLIED